MGRAAWLRDERLRSIAERLMISRTINSFNAVFIWGKVVKFIGFMPYPQARTEAEGARRGDNGDEARCWQYPFGAFRSSAAGPVRRPSAWWRVAHRAVRG